VKTLCFETALASPADVVWAQVTTMDGVNAERVLPIDCTSRTRHPASDRAPTDMVAATFRHRHAQLARRFGVLTGR